MQTEESLELENDEQPPVFACVLWPDGNIMSLERRDGWSRRLIKLPLCYPNKDTLARGCKENYKLQNTTLLIAFAVLDTN